MFTRVLSILLTSPSTTFRSRRRRMGTREVRVPLPTSLFLPSSVSSLLILLNTLLRYPFREEPVTTLRDVRPSSFTLSSSPRLHSPHFHPFETVGWIREVNRVRPDFPCLSLRFSSLTRAQSRVLTFQFVTRSEPGYAVVTNEVGKDTRRG